MPSIPDEPSAWPEGWTEVGHTESDGAVYWRGMTSEDVARAFDMPGELVCNSSPNAQTMTDEHARVIADGARPAAITWNDMNGTT